MDIFLNLRGSDVPIELFLMRRSLWQIQLNPIKSNKIFCCWSIYELLIDAMSSLFVIIGYNLKGYNKGIWMFIENEYQELTCGATQDRGSPWILLSRIQEFDKQVVEIPSFTKCVYDLINWIALFIHLLRLQALEKYCSTI